MDANESLHLIMSKIMTSVATAEAIRLHYINHMVEHHGYEREALANELQESISKIFAANKAITNPPQQN